MNRIVRRRFIILACLSVVACGSKQEGPRTPSTGDAFAGPGQVSCSAVRPQSEPDLMAWDPGSRMSLNALADQGVVAVRYSANGCDVELEVLANCIGEGEYQYKPYSSTDTKVAKSAQDLYAQLPLGASRLVGKLQGDRALRTDYVLVGMATLPAGAVYPYSALKGPDCARATHVVSRVYLGGFAMAAGEAQTLQAGASVFGAGAGASRTSSNERLATEGDPAQCDRARTTGERQPLCNVPLRIGLQPLEGAPAAEAAASAGPARGASGTDDPADAQYGTLMLDAGKAMLAHVTGQPAGRIRVEAKGDEDELRQDFVDAKLAPNPGVLLVFTYVEATSPTRTPGESVELQAYSYVFPTGQVRWSGMDARTEATADLYGDLGPVSVADAGWQAGHAHVVRALGAPACALTPAADLNDITPLALPAAQLSFIAKQLDPEERRPEQCERGKSAVGPWHISESRVYAIVGRPGKTTVLFGALKPLAGKLEVYDMKVSFLGD